MTAETDMNRKLLVGKKNAFNQVRNAVYWLERFFKQANLGSKEITERFMEMGKNIGATFVQEINPSTSNISLLIEDLYQITVKSKVKIEIKGNQVRVTDDKCALCKYQYNDIDIAGCTISMAMVGEMLERLGFPISSMNVVKSKCFGDEVCAHQFELSPKGSK